MMKALVLEEKGASPVHKAVQEPEPVIESDQVLVNIESAALNHRDVWIKQGLYPGLKYPVILGSDAAGTIGSRNVIIQPGINWGILQKSQSIDYQILGSPSNGTFAEFIKVDKSQVFDMPGHLTHEQASALPLAGLTAYRVLFSRCNARENETLLITGIGGGVALFCFQFALASGLKVYVTSGSDKKIEKALQLGAIGGENYNNDGWAKRLEAHAGGFDIVIDSGGGKGFLELLKICNPGARIGIYGGGKGFYPPLSPQLIFWKQLSILGSTMGSDADFSNMVAFVNSHKVVPIIDSVYDLENGANAFARMEKGLQFGKIVLKMPQKKGNS